VREGRLRKKWKRFQTTVIRNIRGVVGDPDRSSSPSHALRIGDGIADQLAMSDLGNPKPRQSHAL
jgi:hypothetical protein